MYMYMIYMFVYINKVRLCQAKNCSNFNISKTFLFQQALKQQCVLFHSSTS